MTTLHLYDSWVQLWVWGGGEMVDAADLKSAGRKSVWVRIPPALLEKTHLWVFFFEGFSRS